MVLAECRSGLFTGREVADEVLVPKSAFSQARSERRPAQTIVDPVRAADIAAL